MCDCVREVLHLTHLNICGAAHGNGNSLSIPLTVAHAMFFSNAVELNQQITAWMGTLPAFTSCFAPMGTLAKAASPPIMPSLT